MAGRNFEEILRVIDSLQLTGRERLLDVCTGTADVAIGAARRSAGAARVVGVDFSGAMLANGLQKVMTGALDPRIQLVRGDAMHLPVASGTVDAATIAFGIRNVQAPEVACRELFRVLRPGGRLAILEFGDPKSPLFGPVYRWYSHHILPRIGRLVSQHDAAYTYLPKSIGAFAYGDDFVECCFCGRDRTNRSRWIVSQQRLLQLLALCCHCSKMRKEKKQRGFDQFKRTISTNSGIYL